jgi:hypothetical protein
MSEFGELLEKLNKDKIIQSFVDWDESLPKDIWENHFRYRFKEVEFGLDVETHRWYEISTSVVQIYERFLGIRHITNVFSEGMDVEDCYVNMEFFEMEEVKVISYKKV